VIRGLNECIVRLEPDSAKRISASMQVLVSYCFYLFVCHPIIMGELISKQFSCLVFQGEKVHSAAVVAPIKQL
jgi:hypothetical protein